MRIENERFNPEAGLLPWTAKEHQARYEFAKEFVREKMVVDCACGSGAGTHQFLRAGARELWAFDIAPESIESAKARCGDDRSAHFNEASATKLPLPDDFADVYISFETIEHIESDQLYLAEARRVLKPGGLFICSTPNRIVKNPGKTLNDTPANRYHVREYSEDEFYSLVTNYFAVCGRYGQNPVSDAGVSLLAALGSVLPRHGAARLQQTGKLIMYPVRKDSYYAVLPARSGQQYEFLCAVCRKAGRPAP